jgi:predicted  nucleic acid-binding Zn-ribbon protein
MIFTSDKGPQGRERKGDAAMGKEASGARKARKLRASRDGWKERAAEKQQEIKRLRGTVRDLTNSRKQWKARAKELEEQVQALQQANATSPASGPTWLFFGG